MDIRVCLLFYFLATTALAAAQHLACNSSSTLQQAQADGSCFWEGGRPADVALVQRLQQCLAGKRIYIVGTSVSRHWYFQLEKLMSADSRRHWQRKPDSANYRARQKAQCGGGTEAAREGCRSSVGADMVFRWQNQNIFDAELGSALLAQYDIVIANMGLGNIVHHPFHWQGRMLSQGRQLAHFLATQVPSSTRFYWRTTTPICRSSLCPPGTSLQNCGVPEDANAMIELSNLVLTQLLREVDPRVQVLDVLPLTSCQFYEDHVHHPTLTIDHLLLFASKECPQLTPQIAQTCPHLSAALQGHSHGNMAAAGNSSLAAGGTGRHRRSAAPSR